MLARLDHGESGNEIEHAPVVGEHVGTKPPVGPRGGGTEYRVEEQRSEASILPVVLYHERDLHGVGLLEGVVAAYGDELGIAACRVFDDQREAPAVVDRGEDSRPVGGQAFHDREEPMMGAVAALAAVERLQSRCVVRTDRSQSHDGAVPEGERVLELGGVLGVWCRHGVILVDRGSRLPGAAAHRWGTEATARRPEHR